MNLFPGLAGAVRQYAFDAIAHPDDLAGADFQVRGLNAMLNDLREQGVTVEPNIEEYDYGRFAWIMDPEGTRIELWEPTPGWKPPD